MDNIGSDLCQGTQDEQTFRHTRVGQCEVGSIDVRFAYHEKVNVHDAVVVYALMAL